MTPRPGNDLWAGDAEVGRRVSVFRHDLGLSLRELGLQVEASSGFLSRIERGTKSPSLPMLLALAEVFGTTALFLMTGEPGGLCPFCRRDCK